MPPVADTFTSRGGCHCGRLRVVFSAAREPAGMLPRACDCTFCTKHGAAYVSDPGGQLSIVASGADALRRYRQGSGTAEFLLCARCGVLVAVIFDDGTRVYGAVNVRALERPADFGAAVPASPQSLTAAEKIQRWSQLWIPNVELLTSGG
jgi:hypothetical protein